MSGLNPVETFQFRIYFWNQHLLSPWVQQFLNKLDGVGEVMPVEVWLVAFIFKNKNGHPNDLIPKPDSTAWKTIEQSGVSLDKNAVVANIDNFGDNTSFDGGHHNFYFLENSRSIPIFPKT